MNCPHCDSKNTIKKGAWTRNGDRVPKLLCKECGRYFSGCYLSPEDRSQINRANGMQRQNIVDEWTHKRIATLRKQGLTKPLIAKRLKISVDSVNTHLKEQGLVKPRMERTYTLVSPEGKTITFTNIKQFAKENGLNYSGLKDFLTRRWRSRNWYCCQGWTKPNTQPPVKDAHPWRMEAKYWIELRRNAVAARSP